MVVTVGWVGGTVVPTGAAGGAVSGTVMMDDGKVESAAGVSPPSLEQAEAVKSTAKPKSRNALGLPSAESSPAITAPSYPS